MTRTFTPEHRGGSGPPLVLVHGFVDTWRSWELVLDALESHHDVLAPTLPGHAGGPPLTDPVTDDMNADAVERAMDAAGFDTAHIVGNSLGGYVALQLAQRGRARSVVALAPGGGWDVSDGENRTSLGHFTRMHEQLQTVVANADAIVASDNGRRAATRFITERYDHIPAELLAHQLCGAAICDVPPLVAFAQERRMSIDPQRITCPVRIVWGTEDRLLTWPDAATRYREEWLPDADWVVLDGVGHCPQLDVPLETAQLILGFTT